MSRPLKHHYIPVFYLKRWLLGGEQIVEFSRPFGNKVKPRRTHPSGTGYVDRLYALRGLPEELAQQVEEKVFKPVDTRAADVMEALHGGEGPKNTRDRMAWTQFLVSMLIRNPEELRNMKAIYSENYLRTTRKDERRYAKDRSESDPIRLSEYLSQASQAHIEMNAMQAFVASLSAPHTTKHIFRMKWGHIQLPFSAPALLTSDRPIITEGLAKPNGHIVLPIGPKLLFYAVNRKVDAEHLVLLGADDLVRRVNTQVATHAHKYVYGTSDKFLNFVQNYMSSDPSLLVSSGFKRYPGGAKIKKKYLDATDRILREE